MPQANTAQALDPLLGKPRPLAQLAGYQAGSIVSVRLLQRPAGNVTFFAFDQGQELSEHTAPFDALVTVVDGEADIMTGGTWHRVAAGEALLLPAHAPHAVKAAARFKMVLTMVRS